MIQVDKIEIGKSVEALHEWHKLALTVTILPDQDPIEVHKEAKALLDRLLPGIDAGAQYIDEPKPVNQRIASLIEDINKCTAINYVNGYNVQEGLIAYEEMAQTNPEIKAAYDLRLKQLSK